MRHGKKFNHLGRKSAHRKAMMANMASSLILNKRVQTTTAKAKALRSFVEPLITKAKDDRTHTRRIVFKYLQNKEAVSELFRDVAEKISERPGGYTRILKTGNRLGDNAEMCFIELVDYNENYSTSTGTKSKSSKRRRRRGGSGKKSTSTEQKQEQTATAEEDQAQSAEATQQEMDMETKEKTSSEEKQATEPKMEENKDETKSEGKAEEKKQDSDNENKEDK